MKKSIITPFIILLLMSNCYSQVIRRWSEGKFKFKDMQLISEIRKNIFEDYGWSIPNMASKKIIMTNNIYDITITGKKYQLTKNTNTEMKLTNSEGWTAVSTLRQSNGNIYYDKSKLKMRSETKYKWVSHYTTTATTVPVIKYRNTTTYQYDAMSHTSKPVYRTESYTSYETRYVPKTTWTWEPYTVYVLDIPNYNYYSFDLPDGQQIYFYEAGNDLFMQIPSYLYAVDENGISYIFVDYNTNGYYIDGDDDIMINSWNPFSKESRYKPSPYAKSNTWYDIKYLYEEYFIVIELNDKTLSINNKNSIYYNESEKGQVNFINMPEDAEVKINGKEYKIKKNNKPFKSEFGIFKVTVSRPGYMDYVSIYTIDEKNPVHQIDYVATNKGGQIDVQNVFAEDFFITVTNAGGYYKTYHNEQKFSLPEGDCTIEISSDGNSISYPVYTKAGETVIFDFEAELKKMKKD
jgi:hypothetical protein